MSSHNSYMPMLGRYSSHGLNCLESGVSSKQKRKPPGTPDPDAEVVYLSPETLMESDHYVCEICNQGFQREQNLQMHRRRHNVPWKLLKRVEMEVRKRVYVCPDPTCLHHDPTHALGDLVGIKKHFRRKHSNDKQWVCEKCFKGYAVQSDFRAHLKTCGTRGHSCDCGRVFSRVETFIKHQDTCKAKSTTIQNVWQPSKPAYLLEKNSLSPSLSITTNSKMPKQTDLMIPHGHDHEDDYSATSLYNNIQLQLFTSSNNLYTQLNLSLGSVNHQAGKLIELNRSSTSTSTSSLEHQDNCKADYSKERVVDIDHDQETVLERLLKDEAREQLSMAMEEKVFAEEKRRQAKWQIELANQDFINAKKIREQALIQLNKANVLKECAMKKINSNILAITCNACKREFQEIITMK